jgi:hypothetical protein
MGLIPVKSLPFRDFPDAYIDRSRRSLAQDGIEPALCKAGVAKTIEIAGNARDLAARFLRMG